jgi:hypothetical protein
MSIIQGFTRSFYAEVLQGLHNFTESSGNAFKLALYTSDADLGPTTTVYSATNEITATGYGAGGQDVLAVTPTIVGNTAVVDFADVSWTSPDMTGVRGGLIYNSTNGNRAVMVLDFGSDKSQTGGTFVVQFPTADATSAIIRLGA